MCLQQIPPEMILAVAEFLEVKDIASLILTARRFSRILTVTLYNSALTYRRVYSEDEFVKEHGECSYRRPRTGERVLVDFDLSTIEYADRWKSEHVLEFFQTKDVEVFTAWDVTGIPLLHRLATKGAYFVIKTLLERGADVNAQAMGRYTPLSWMATFLRTEDWEPRMPLVQLLVEYGADPLVENSVGQTVFFPVARYAPGRVVKYFLDLMLDAGGDVWKKDDRGNTPLWEAISKGRRNADTVKVLLEYGADVLEEDKGGSNALHKAAHRGDPDVFREVLQAVQAVNGDISAPNQRQCNALHMALSFNNEEIAAMLIEAGADILAKDDANCTPLDLILNKEMLDAFEALVKNSAHLWPLQQLRREDIFMAVSYGRADAILMMVRLLELGAVTPPDPHLAEDGDDTSLHAFCALWNRYPRPLKIATCLLKLGEQVDVPGNGGNTPLHTLLLTRTIYDDSMQYLWLVKRLLFEYKEPFTFKNDNGNTILHLAAAQGDIRLVKMVLDHIDPATLFVRNKQGFTVLHCAVNPRCEKTFRHILQRIVQVSSCYPSKPLINFFLTRGVNIHAKTKKGRTALHMACSDRSKIAAVHALIEAGADVEMPDYEGFPPLHWANTHECDQAVEALLEAGAELHEKCYTCDPRLVHMEHPQAEMLKRVRGYNGQWASEVLSECSSVWSLLGDFDQLMRVSRDYLWPRGT
ncbi:hypothetical protein VTO42DRAFT_5909 [Malbranchea cinnamomea]